MIAFWIVLGVLSFPYFIFGFKANKDNRDLRKRFQEDHKKQEEEWENQWLFERWAYGDPWYLDENRLKRMRAWNDKHGEKLMLKESGCFWEDMEKIKQLWKDEVPK